MNQVSIGGNYGWRCREGAHDFNTGGTPGCNAGTLIDPVTEYDHALGNSITGGYVYRGSQSTSLAGRYLFGDFGSGRIWAWLAENAAQPREPTQLLETGLNIASFGQGNDGELYVVNYGGTLHRINFQASAGTGTAPRSLSDTGCVSATDPKQPASGLIPYAINAPFWSDGADKERWMALARWSEHHRANRWRLELPRRHGAGEELPYRHALDRNAAVHAPSRRRVGRLQLRMECGADARQRCWKAARCAMSAAVATGSSRANRQCLECHTQAAGRALGLETAQLNRSYTYPQTNRTANELATLNHIGVLTPSIPDAATQPALPDPSNTSASLSDRARARICIPTARNVIALADRRRATWICATRPP